jgi:hypothetical protein
LAIGIAENPLLGILGQKGQNFAMTRLERMLFHQGVFAVEGNGMEIQIKRTPPASLVPDGINHSRITEDRSRINPTTIFGEKGPFGNHIDPANRASPRLT